MRRAPCPCKATSTSAPAATSPSPNWRGASPGWSVTKASSHSTPASPMAPRASFLIRPSSMPWVGGQPFRWTTDWRGPMQTTSAACRVPLPLNLDPWLLERLACPVHRTGLIADAQVLKCEHGCRYPVVEGVPVMLLEGEAQTIKLAQASIRLSREGMADQGLYLDTLGVTDEERRELADAASAPRPGTIDPVVSY